MPPRSALQRVLRWVAGVMRWATAFTLVAAPGGLAWLFYMAAAHPTQFGAAQWIGIGFIGLILLVFQFFFTLLAGAVTGVIAGGAATGRVASSADDDCGAAATAALATVVAMPPAPGCD